MTDTSEYGSKINRRLVQNSMLRRIVDRLGYGLPESDRDLFNKVIRSAYKAGNLSGWREAVGLFHKGGP
jgi:hypothetical protein